MCVQTSAEGEEEDKKTVSQELKQTLRSPVLLWRLLNCCFCW